MADQQGSMVLHKVYMGAHRLIYTYISNTGFVNNYTEEQQDDHNVRMHGIMHLASTLYCGHNQYNRNSWNVFKSKNLHLSCLVQERQQGGNRHTPIWKFIQTSAE